MLWYLASTGCLWWLATLLAIVFVFFLKSFSKKSDVDTIWQWDVEERTTVL